VYALFLVCLWMNVVMIRLMLKCLVIPIRLGWDEIVKDGEKNWKGKGLKCKSWEGGTENSVMT